MTALARSLGPVTDRHHTAMLLQMQSVFGISAPEAMELSVLGAWMADQCGTPGQAVSRLSRRLYRLSGVETLPDMERMIDSIFARDGTLPEDIEAGLQDIRRTLRA